MYLVTNSTLKVTYVGKLCELELTVLSFPFCYQVRDPYIT